MKRFSIKTEILKQMTTSLVAISIGLTGEHCFSQEAFGSNQETIRDGSVVPSDFQRETPAVDLTLQSMEENKGIRSDFTNENVASPVDSLFGTLQEQTNDLDLPKVFGSLAIVLGGYLGFVWLTRRLGVSGNQGLPTEVVEVLGQTAFGQRKQLQLVRLGSKLLLLLNNHDGSTQTIGEITDPHEVDYLSSICGKGNPSRSAIAISKATSSQEKPDLTGNELKRVLRQLQQSGERNRAGTVFDA